MGITDVFQKSGSYKHGMTVRLLPDIEKGNWRTGIAYSSDRGQRFHSDGGHHSTLMAVSFSHALEALPSVS